jgi:hypothetical protein
MKLLVLLALLLSLLVQPAAAQPVQPQGTPRVVTAVEVQCESVDAGTETFRCVDAQDAIEFDVHTADKTWIEVWPLS